MHLGLHEPAARSSVLAVGAEGVKLVSAVDGYPVCRGVERGVEAGEIPFHLQLLADPPESLVLYASRSCAVVEELSTAVVREIVHYFCPNVSSSQDTAEKQCEEDRGSHVV